MKSKFDIFLSVILLCNICLADIPLYNPTRTSFYTTACQSQPRKQFVKKIEKYDTNYYVGNLTERFYEADPQVIFKAVIAQDTRQLYSELNNDSSASWANYIVLYIGLGILLLMVPCLLAGICCPKCYNKNRKPKTYSSCAICCPNCITILFSAAILALSIYLLLYGLSFRSVYSDIKCSSAMVPDNLLNGNIDEENNKFFRGLDYLIKINSCLDFFCVNQLRNLTQNLLTNGTQIMQEINKLENQISQITSKNNETIVLNYQAPLLTSQNSYQIQSQIPNIIGSPATPKSIIGSLSEIVNSLQQQIASLLVKANNFIASLNKIQKQSETILSDLKSHQKQIQNSNSKLQTFFDIIQDKGIFAITKGIFFAILGGLILFSFLAILLSCCSMMRRGSKCIGFVCVLIWILGVVTFLLCIVLSFAYPTAYYTCKQIQTSLQNKSQFIKLIGSQFPSQKQIIQLFGTCLQQQQVNTSLLSDYTELNITALMQLPSNLQPIQSQSQKLINQTLLINFQENKQKLEKYRLSILMDIDDQSALGQILKISQAGRYDCNVNGFREDSWIPYAQNKVIPCKIINNQKQNVTAKCFNISDFENGASSCSGCISTVQIGQLYTTNNNQTNFIQGLKIRYPQCNTFNQELSNLWTNYYLPKIQTLTPIIDNFDITSKSASQLSSNFANNLQPAFNAFKQPNIQDVIDTKQGFIAGSYCGIIGDDIRNAHRIVCNQGTEYLYIMRIILIVLAFCTLPIVCCMSCSYYQNQFDSNSSSSSSSNRKNRMQTQTVVQTERVMHPYPYHKQKIQTPDYNY